jgi:mannose-6-phosphate isomerase-like protein (cupin superfamily)
VEELEPTIDRSLYQNRKARPAEIVYEVTTNRNNLPFGIAIADIERSESHFHKVTIETYTVVQGDLEVRLITERRILHPGDTLKIPLGAVHSARTLNETPARITETTIPEYSPDDYYAVKDGRHR